MGTIEDIKKMQEEGRTEDDISRELRDRGLTKDEISNAMSQAQIKQAVLEHQESNEHEDNFSTSQFYSPPEEEIVGSPAPERITTRQYSEQDMQPSIMSSEYPQQQETAPQTYQQEQYPSAQQDYYQQYPQDAQGAQGYGSYDQYASAGLSPDTITEIAEQTIAERFAPLKDQLEKAIDFRNTISTKIESLSERLIRIEKIMDRLQLSILQKVGDYVTNVEDIKRELIETQKTFSSIASRRKTTEHKTPSQKKTRK